MASILIKGFGVWLVILLAAVGNGVFRDLVMTPKLGDPAARAISCFTLSILIVLITWVFIARLGISAKSQLWPVGWFWLALTLAFEFLFGRYVGGKSWMALFEDYNIVEGRLWILVLATTLLAPVLAGRLRKIV